MNTETILTSGDCAYWIDGAGNIYHGRMYLQEQDVWLIDILTRYSECTSEPGSVLCV